MQTVILNRGSDALLIVDLVDDAGAPVDLTGAALDFFEPSAGLAPVAGQPAPMAAALHGDPGAVRVAIYWSARLATAPVQQFRLRAVQQGDALFPAGRATTTPVIRVRFT